MNPSKTAAFSALLLALALPARAVPPAGGENPGGPLPYAEAMAMLAMGAATPGPAGAAMSAAGAAALAAHEQQHALEAGPGCSYAGATSCAGQTGAPPTGQQLLPEGETFDTINGVVYHCKGPGAGAMGPPDCRPCDEDCRTAKLNEAQASRSKAEDLVKKRAKEEKQRQEELAAADRRMGFTGAGGTQPKSAAQTPRPANTPSSDPQAASGSTGGGEQDGSAPTSLFDVANLRSSGMGRGGGSDAQTPAGTGPAAVPSASGTAPLDPEAEQAKTEGLKLDPETIASAITASAPNSFPTAATGGSGGGRGGAASTGLSRGGGAQFVKPDCSGTYQSICDGAGKVNATLSRDLPAIMGNVHERENAETSVQPVADRIGTGNQSFTGAVRP